MKKETSSEPVAAKLMTQLVPKININDSAQIARQKLLADIKKNKSINYLYVLDNDGILKGVLSIKELFRQADKKKVSSFMIKNLTFCHASAGKEEIAFLALKDGLKSLPVTDSDGRFIGAVLSDDILKIVYDELQEDVSLFLGLQKIHPQTEKNAPKLLSSLKNRLPWLIVGILGGLLTAQVISFFEETLASNIILASFIPLVVYTSSAVGTQAGFFIVRDLAINKRIDFISYFLGQFRVILAMGIIISLLIFGFSLFTYREMTISLILYASMLLTIISSVITGVVIPYMFSRLKLDPASGSGPLATIIQDLTSVLIYLFIASALLP